jgi:hypothetical protein
MGRELAQLGEGTVTEQASGSVCQGHLVRRPQHDLKGGFGIAARKPNGDDGAEGGLWVRH